MATVQQYISQKLDRFGASLTDMEYEILLSKLNLTPSITATATNVDLALAYALNEVIASVPKRVSEGDYSKEFDTTAMTAYRDRLFLSAGIVNPFVFEPTVTNASDRW